MSPLNVYFPLSTHLLHLSGTKPGQYLLYKYTYIPHSKYVSEIFKQIVEHPESNQIKNKGL